MQKLYCRNKTKKEEAGDTSLKHCIKCKKDKKKSEFSKNPNAPDGFKIFCKSCHKEMRKENKENRTGN